MKYTPLDQRPPKERRDFLIYYARVMLREAHARRGSKGNDWMLRGAARARREAAAIDVRPAQGALFTAESHTPARIRGGGEG